MEIEQLEIRDFLSKCAPMDKLDDKVIDKLVPELEISYHRRNTEILIPGNINKTLYLIRTGAVEILDQQGELDSHLETGDWFGYRSVLHGGEIRRLARASEDTLAYQISADVFKSLVRDHETVKQFFSDITPDRLKHAITEIKQKHNANFIGAHAADLVHREPLQLDCKISIHEAAKLMQEKTVTSALIIKDDILRGIVTDRAFCIKLAVNRMDFDQPVSDIMTHDPITISPETTGSEALLIMSRHNIRHLPVERSGKVLGMLTAADIIRHESNTPIYLIKEIHRAVDLASLKKYSDQIPCTLVSLVQNSLTAYDIAHAISSIGEGITQRMLHFAEKEFGEAPIPYAWITAGSLARNEQTVRSDQDNALILSDDYDEQEHGEYFRNLSQYVCDGLNECGYIYCPGDVMATNEKWRQPLIVWHSYFNDWIHKPKQKSLMYSSIFFDLRCIYGDESLLSELRQKVLEQSKGNSIFLAHMAANALQFHPPLGLFRRFVLEKGGQEEKALNMKKRGVIPITDFARVYALAAGVDALNTSDRLSAAADAGELSKEGREDLLDAFEFISIVRLHHQAEQIDRGEAADNFVQPEQLSSLERRHLKDAFEVVRTMQTSMERRYQAGSIG